MKILLDDAHIEVDGHDISNFVSDVQIVTTRDVKEVTGMGSKFKEKLVGLGDGTMTFTAFEDFAAASIDAIFWPLSQSNTPFTVKVRPTSDPVSATNPSYEMDCLLSTYNPIAGQVGEPATTPLTLENATQAGLTRHTS